MMRTAITAWAVLLALLAGTLAQASVTGDGVTGLLSVPTAEVVREGAVTFGSGRFLRRMGGDHEAVARTYYTTFGYLPGVEITARFIDFPLEMDDNGTTNFQDRAVAVKYAHLFNDKFALAAGATDVAGESRAGKAMYGVATYHFTPDLNASIGAGSDRLDGVFGGVSYLVHERVKLLGEFDTHDFNYGIELRPLKGMTMTAGMVNGHAAFGGTYTVPLDPRGRETPCQPVALPRCTEAYAEPCDQAAAVRDALVAQSFENVVTAVADGTLFVEFENRRFREQIDALGVAAALAASLAGPGIERVVVSPKLDDVPMLTLQASVDELADFFADPTADPACIDITPYCAGGYPPDTVFAAEGNKKNWHGEALIRPLHGFEGARPGLATLQTKWGLGLVEHVFPAHGLQLQARQDWYLQNDIEAERGNTDPQNRDAWATYTERLRPNIYGTATAGYFGDAEYGGFAEANYYVPQGRWKFGGRYGYTRTSRTGSKVNEDGLGLGQVGYYEPTLDWDLTAMGGMFLKGDRGYLLESRRYFGPTEITFFGYDTDGSRPEGGFRLFLPLPWYGERRHGAWRIDSAPYFAYQYRTESKQWGALAPPGFDLETMRQRLRPEYVAAHLDAFRRAAWLALDTAGSGE